MNKKFLILLTLTFLVIAPSTLAFSDIENHWAKDVINQATNLKIVAGYEDGTFKPDAYMTRAELVAALNRLLSIEVETDKYIPDVTSKDWFYSDIRKAMSVGIIKGDENGFIKPNDYVTREQVALILARAFCIQNNNSVINVPFSDIDDISDWAKNEFLDFIRDKYITGYPDNTIKPQNNITRAEVLAILNRIVKNNISNSTVGVKINGNTLIKGKNIILKNTEIYGNLIISENVSDAIDFINVIINGNLILYSPVNLEDDTIKVNGDIIKVYENRISSNLYYTNNEYGISFPLPDGARVVNKNEVTKADYYFDDLIIVDVKQDDEYYFESIENISKEVIKLQGYDSIYRKIKAGKIDTYSYELYEDNTKSSLLVIKRDNIVYSLLCLNVVSNNILENIMLNMQFSSGDRVINYEDKIYKNAKLCLKFIYKDGYVGVDDSYNTGTIYSGDAFFKLFIQVNMITDIDEYSIEEVTSLLRSFVKSDGELVNEEVKSIINHDAIQFEIVSEEDKIISLYVIVGNNLYNFIFRGTKVQMDAIGYDMYEEIIKSMEF